MFKNYGHIENLRDFEEMPSMEAVATVKIDGANFQIGVDENGKLFTCSRNRQLTAGEDFCGSLRVIEKMDIEAKLKSLGKPVRIYGELCGGLYRHPAVAPVKGAVRIQGRVDYSPDNEWVPFDAELDGRWLSQYELAELCDRLDLPCQEIYFRGTFAECCKIEPTFQDTTGNRLWGLPLIDGNVAEGLVIKPVEYCVDRRGNRIIVKNKNVKFKERIRATKEKTKGVDLTEPEKRWADVLQEYYTESRAWSVVSKLGENERDFGSIAKAMLADAWEDFIHDNGEAFETDVRTIDPQELDIDKMKKSIAKIASDAVRPVFLKINR